MKRSKRHALAVATAPKPLPTRNQLARRARERRRVRNLLVVVSGALLIALAVVAYGYWREVLSLGGQPIAEIGGQPITTESFARYLAANQALIDQQMANVAQAATAAGSDPSKPPYQQKINQLQQQRQFLPYFALSEYEEALLLRREAESRGIVLTDDELSEAIIAEGRRIRDGPSVSLTQSTDDAPDPPPESPMTLEDAKAAIRSVLARVENPLTEEEYQRLFVEPQALRDRLTEELGKDVPTTAEQVHARHILVANEDEANAIKERLEKGEDFATLAREHSTDPGSKDKGGDLGWFPRGVMTPEFEIAAFAQEPGQQYVVVKSTYGWHVIQVLEKDPNRSLSEEQLREEREKKFDEWLQDLKSSQIVTHSSDNKIRWAQRYADEAQKAAQTEA